MQRLLLATFLLLPAVLLAQDTTTCSQLTIDLDGDLQIGAGDILMLLGGYGTDLDVDGDMVPDCQDDCVGAYDICGVCNGPGIDVDEDGVCDLEDDCIGAYDTCGVCNGPGPQVLAIDTIIIAFDSVYAEAIDEWLIFELNRDTVLHLVCENPGCTDPLATNFDPYAQEGGACDYSTWPCGALWSFDGYSYATTLIGNQCWFAENLRTTVYANGDLIPAGLTDGEWSSTATGATAVYGEGSSGCNHSSPDIDACDEAQSLAAYGRLYNWYAVDDTRGLCPNGWHVPTHEDYFELMDFLGSQGFAGFEGVALMATSGYWFDPDDGPIVGTDDFGFTAVPSGRRENFGYFSGAGSGASLWFSDNPSNTYLGSESAVMGLFGADPKYGQTVRCLKDAE